MEKQNPQQHIKKLGEAEKLRGGQKQQCKTTFEQRIFGSHLVWNAVWSLPRKRNHFHMKGLFSDLYIPTSKLFCALMKNTGKGDHSLNVILRK